MSAYSLVALGGQPEPLHGCRHLFFVGDIVRGIHMNKPLSDFSAQTKQKCNGLIFRARENIYISSRGEFIRQEKMIPMKRLSCGGCDQCEYMPDLLYEELANGGMPIIKGDFDNEALYTLDVINISRDWETGIVDDWTLAFIKQP